MLFTVVVCVLNVPVVSVFLLIIFSAKFEFATRILFAKLINLILSRGVKLYKIDVFKNAKRVLR